MGAWVRITDVSPRDGLQNEPGVIATPDKATLIQLVLAANVAEVEATSFVNPKWVPQLADAAEVLRRACLAPRPVPRREGGQGGAVSVLIPNMQGFEAAMALRREGVVIDKVCLFTAASETFNKKNTNASIAESLERFRPVVAAAYAEDLELKLYISCAFGCPFEGEVPAAHVERVAQACLQLAYDAEAALDAEGEPGDGDFPEIEISLADTIGVATPEQVRELCARVMSPTGACAELWQKLPQASVNLHLHDTFGRAGACVKAGLEAGVRSFDGSVAGLGGCPYASTPGTRAPGNIATEQLVAVVEQAGFETGVDAQALADAGVFARSIVGAARAAAQGGGSTP